MRLQPWAEGQARVDMAAVHRFLGGGAQLLTGREMVLGRFGHYIKRW